jgi:predicted small secreted protein
MEKAKHLLGQILIVAAGVATWEYLMKPILNKAKTAMPMATSSAPSTASTPTS